MLGLKLATDPRWADIAQADLQEILTDHAYCEQKAASNAISLIVGWPELSDLVATMADIAQEEMNHFARVHAHIVKRGLRFGRERKDAYVNELYAFIRKGVARDVLLMDRLLFAAMVEARSCERFRILSTEAADAELREFYHELMVSEAQHYTTFLNLARKYCDRTTVDARWQEWLTYEAEVVTRYGTAATMHG